MGCWGYKLYEDDVAQDVRDTYIDLLHRGKTDKEATDEVVAQYQNLDDDDKPVFWFALADTQWNYGRLTPSVKDKALKHLASQANQHLWEKSSPGYAEKRAAVLSALEEQLLSPQPEVKLVKPYKLYKCQWKIGDVFAYCLDGDSAKGSVYDSRYVFFVKVDERFWHPGHTIPIVYFFRTLAQEPVSLDVLKTVGYLPQFFVPDVYLRNPEKKRLYRVSLVCTSARAIPKKLIYLGNIGAVQPAENEDPSAHTLLWKNFESYTIRNLNNWELDKL